MRASPCPSSRNRQRTGQTATIISESSLHDLRRQGDLLMLVDDEDLYEALGIPRCTINFLSGLFPPLIAPAIFFSCLFVSVFLLLFLSEFSESSSCKSGARSREGRADTNMLRALGVPIDISKSCAFSRFLKRSLRSHDSPISMRSCLASSVETPCTDVDEHYIYISVLPCSC
ncbi:hypothetical protein F5B17DRAFT_297577 [Nemania serpens]|nr:hypothetical protein F5B17DRAFT_297577 [Nemania serpens]